MMLAEKSKPPFPQEKKSSLEDTMAELAKFQMEMQNSQEEWQNS